MNKTLSVFFIIVVSFAIFMLERSYMFKQDLVGETIVSTTVYIGLLIIVSLAAILLSKQSIGDLSVSRRFTILMIVVYILSLLFAFVHPFGSRYTYFFIILPLLLFFFPSKVYSDKYNGLLLWSMIIVAVLLTFFYYNNYSNNILYNIEQQYNGSYSVLYLLPFLLCVKNRYLRFGLMAMVLFIVIISLKRGGFFAVIAGLLAFFIISYFSLKGNRFKVGHYLILISAITVLYFLIDYINLNFTGSMLYDRIGSIEENEGGGRFEIYKNYIGFIASDSLFHWIFGHGWAGSLDSGFNVTCHNDFLEVFVDFGLIGFSVYISFWVALFKLTRRMIREKFEYAAAMGASLAIFFVNSMVSHIFIYSWYMIEFSLFWGYMVAVYRFSQMTQNKVIGNH